jgi:hypothetical protein
MKHETSAKLPDFLHRMGAATFLFFLIKGLLWLAVPMLYLWVS